MTDCLYRMFDKDGKLLYVGISCDFGRRFGEHASDKDWWGDVATITVQHLRSRGAALTAERNAIFREKPLWNVQHNVNASKPVPKTMLSLMQEDEKMLAEAEAAHAENPAPCAICGHHINGEPYAMRLSDWGISIVHRACGREYRKAARQRRRKESA